VLKNQLLGVFCYLTKKQKYRNKNIMLQQQPLSASSTDQQQQQHLFLQQQQQHAQVIE